MEPIQKTMKDLESMLTIINIEDGIQSECFIYYVDDEWDKYTEIKVVSQFGETLEYSYKQGN